MKSIAPCRIGELFHFLKIIGGPIKSNYRWTAACECKCGVRQQFRIAATTGIPIAQSCGCHRRENVIRANSTHGKSRKPGISGYGCWRSMIQRCENENNERYSEYGGRGIAVCDRWRRSFEAFIADMGDRPSLDHSIDRIDGDGDYCPENCKWSTSVEQARNRKSSRYLTVNGEKKLLQECAVEAGIRPGTLRERLRRGWGIERVLSEPTRVK